MIVIDGRESQLAISSYANLEETLTAVIAEEGLDTRIITDVLLDEEPFSELYPHQAEDIETESFSRLELRTVSFEQMAKDVIGELPKVIRLLEISGKQVATLLRQRNLAEGLEVLQDMIAVSRDLLNSITVLRSQYSSGPNEEIVRLGDEFGGLLGEIGDSMDNEDWMLVADLMEYELQPSCEVWLSVIDNLATDISKAA
ncbi:hypothetical protein LJC46_06115 [Desulfovibrio sp. OttesenSCG-928-G15]|nr:hypothetical protein [Desulfovibrio sp. OttesenSCG-928-G15]